jgi:hypothetical protein
MRTTAERLSEVYCKTTTYKKMREVIGSLDESVGFGSYCGLPNSDSEMFFYYSESDGYVRVENKKPNRAEIPVQNFIDLIEDKIVAWRLVEDGFEVSEYGYTFKSVYVHNPDPVTKIFVDVETENDAVPFTNVKTYSDLLTLIRLLK